MAYALVVGAGRCMALSHWVTDVVGAMGITWIGMHLIFYRVLKVPDQIRFFDRNRRWPAGPAVWELQLSAWAVGILAGLAMTGLGLRALGHPGAAMLGLLIPAGLGLAVLCARKARVLRRRALGELETEST